MAEKKGYDFGSYDKDALTQPRDLAWDNWAKFEKEGDIVQGYIRDVFYRAEEGEFKAQRGITLEQSDGVLINIAIKRVSFILAKTDNLRLGDPLTVVFEKTLQPKQKGYKGAKQFAFYGKNLEENAGNKTVAELEKLDMEKQGQSNDEDWEDPIATPEPKKPQGSETEEPKE